jgi:hypothetical protein
MGRPIEISRFELSATELRELAARTQTGAVVRRLLAIALQLEGYPREAAAQLNGMDRQTLRDWVLRYNAEGVAGLSSRCSPGRPLALRRSTGGDRVPLVRQRGRAHGRQAAAPASHDAAATAALSSEERRSGPGDF